MNLKIVKIVFLSYYEFNFWISYESSINLNMQNNLILTVLQKTAVAPKIFPIIFKFTKIIYQSL